MMVVERGTETNLKSAIDILQNMDYFRSGRKIHSFYNSKLAMS